MRSEIREPGGEIGQEVDVEWRSCFAAGDRAEEAQMQEAFGLGVPGRGRGGSRGRGRCPFEKKFSVIPAFW